MAHYSLSPSKTGVTAGKWVEVGQGVLTDLGTSRLSDDRILRPAFRQGNYYDGINQALSKAMSLIDGERLPPPPRRSRANG
jgi:uncharacterized protein